MVRGARIRFASTSPSHAGRKISQVSGVSRNPMCTCGCLFTRDLIRPSTWRRWVQPTGKWIISRGSCVLLMHHCQTSQNIQTNKCLVTTGPTHTTEKFDPHWLPRRVCISNDTFHQQSNEVEWPPGSMIFQSWAENSFQPQHATERLCSEGAPSTGWTNPRSPAESFVLCGRAN